MKKINCFYTSALILAVVLVISAGCKSGKKSSASESEANVADIKFPYATAPTLITNSAEIADWISLHFWDSFLDSSRSYPQDTSLIGGISENEFNTAFTNYANHISGSPLKSGLKGQENTMKKLLLFCEAKEDMKLYEKTKDLMEHFFYHPNSPYRSEELYIPVLEGLTSSPYEDSLSIERYSDQLRRCKINRIGEPAHDFTYTTRDGKTGRLYSVKSDYTLIFFSNPECQTCKEITNSFSNLDILNNLIASGKLTILNVYIDEEIPVWYKYSDSYPKNWINCYDPEMHIRDKQLYNVRAIPSLYLLDNQKRTILKDAEPQHIISRLAL